MSFAYLESLLTAVYSGSSNSRYFVCHLVVFEILEVRDMFWACIFVVVPYCLKSPGLGAARFKAYWCELLLRDAALVRSLVGYIFG